MARKRPILGLEDSIIAADQQRWRAPKGKLGQEDSSQISNVFILKLILIVLLLAFAARLFFLNVVVGAKMRELADTNRIRLVATEAPRGKILDRDGKLLAYSQEVYFLKNGQETREISKAEADGLTSRGLAGENATGKLGQIEVGTRRIYPQREVLSHVVGYISSVQKEDLENNSTLNSIDSVGRLGIESTYDALLRGRDGQEIVEVDALGNKVSILGKVEPTPGRDVKLSIDLDLQKKANEALSKSVDKAAKRGAVIVSDSTNGEILALASAPSFDPTDIGKFVTDPNKPFLDRAIAGVYPPGSTFKVVTALAGLESGKIGKDDEIEDVGEFKIGDVSFPNWYFLASGGRDGILKIDRAIARSNDVFFYRVAERTGLTNIRSMAVKLGFGQESGLDLPGEALGLVPGNEWKESSLNTSWYLGDTMHLGIGQGFMLATPLQVNRMTSFMATGVLNKPHLALKVGDVSVDAKVPGEKLVSESNFNVVRDGMRQACEKGGTGWPFFESAYKIGCKTGTAERGLGDPHAWFSAFAPFDSPKVSVTVIVEDGGEGSTVAGPVTKEILDWWMANHK